MRLRSHPIAASPLLAAIVATLLAGCGSSSPAGNGIASKTPEQIVVAARAAAERAVSAHVSGSIVDEGKPISLDMELVSGKGGRGRVVIQGLTVNLIQVDKAVFINAGRAFYTHIAGATAARLLQGKWLKAPLKSQSFAAFSSFTNLRKLIGSTLASHGKLTRGGATTVSGRKAVGVTDAGRGGTLYVASTGTPYPLEIAKGGSGGAGAGKIVFDRWNQPVVLAPPANAVSINQLQSGR